MSNLETVQQIYAAFGRGDVPFILSQLDEQIVWEENGPDYGVAWLKPGQGQEAVLGFFGTVGQDFEIQNFAVEGLCDGGTIVTGLVHMQARIRSTGKQLDDHEVHIWKFNPEGKVLAFRHVVDTHQHIEVSRQPAVAGI